MRDHVDLSAEDRVAILNDAQAHLTPHRLSLFRRLGIDLVIGERAGYRLHNVGGSWLYDLHLNGGTYNLGHRHPELVDTLISSAARLDIGNHHFPSPARVDLAKALLTTQSFGAAYVVYAASGSEAVDVAIKSARQATGRRGVVALEAGYHGRTGLSGAAGDDASARFFLSDAPEDFSKVGFNDIEALERAVDAIDPACVLIEPIPATFGFPSPDPAFLRAVRRLCDERGALLIADEVQTGLGRTGGWWAIETFGIAPDVLVTSKGLGGGLYPIAAVLLRRGAGDWLERNGWAHVTTFGGAELGCVVARKVLEITGRPETWSSISRVSRILGDGLRDIAKRNDYLREVRQTGLVIGLALDHPEGALHAMKALFDEGVWAIFAGYDLSVLQFKPGLLMTDAECGDVLERVDRGLRRAAERRAVPVSGVVSR